MYNAFPPSLVHTIAPVADTFSRTSPCILAMCWVSHAIDPRLPYMVDRSDEYWRASSPAPWFRPGPCDRDKLVPDPNLSILDPWSIGCSACTTVSVGATEKEAAEAAPHRAPPKERSLSTGSGTARVNWLSSPEFAFQLTHYGFMRVSVPQVPGRQR